ncbi:MAG TPA: CopG family transcriptional regulator [Thermodesulfobacteriota bacterium]|nr:CopG family transcriptional regulator [Thermodesulfobacteriota bacterium]HOC38996.1 CopG family transcriptional regulator [Thermodesulfobacteriota bacterium]HQO78929.1 CopG family transcriptional regulator [Thermodesulfobacteriota bacterium]
MKEKPGYRTKPLEYFANTTEVLPPPGQLVSKEDTVKVTISLSKESVEFFKREARRYGTQYQKMIRRLVDLYVEHYKQDIEK